MLVNVFVLSSNETVQLKLDPGDTVAMVKSKIRLQLKIPSNEQRLIYAGLELENEHKLFEYSIQKNSTLQLLICKLNIMHLGRIGDVIEYCCVNYSILIRLYL